MYETFQRFQIYVTLQCFWHLFRNASAPCALIGCADTELVANWPKAVTDSTDYVNEGGVDRVHAEVWRGQGTGSVVRIHWFPSQPPCS